MDVKEFMKRATESAYVMRAFGPPYEQNGTLVIPVALIAGGGGAGANDVTGLGADPPDHPKRAPWKNQGSGAGFGGVVYPLGVYVLKDGNVRWLPSYDLTRVLVAGIGVLSAIVRIRSHRMAKLRSRA
jgi:uncharacterized spore protein YtfJ